MTHAFDTGLNAPLRTIILTGVVDILSSLTIANGLYLASVAPFGAVVRSWTDIDGVEMLARTLEGMAPAMMVSLGARGSRSSGAGRAHGAIDEIEILVYHVSNNARDLVLGRHTADAQSATDLTADPGLHVMLEHADELLVGARIGDNPMIKEIRRDREDELLTRENLTVWLQTYQIGVTHSTNPYRGVTTILQSIRTRLIQENGEVNLPAAKTKPTTIDTYKDDLPHP